VGLLRSVHPVAALVVTITVCLSIITTARSKTNDAATYLYGARCIFHGRNPYNNDNIVAEWVKEGKPARVKPGLPNQMYLTPPIHSLMIIPAIPFRFQIARYIFNALSVVEFLLAAYLLTLLPKAPWDKRTKSLYWVLLPWAAFNAVMVLGQISPASCLMLAAMLCMLQRGRLAGAGVFLSLALTKFTIGIPFVAVALYRRHWRLALAAIAIFGAVNTLFFLEIGPRAAFTDYRAAIRFSMEPDHVDDAGGTRFANHSTIIEAKRLFYMVLGQNRPLVETVSIIFILLAVAAMAFVLRPGSDRGYAFDHPLEIVVATTSALTLLYHRHSDLTVLMFVVYGLLEYRKRWPDRQPRTWMAALIVTMIAAYQQNLYLRLPLIPELVRRATGITALGPPIVLVLFLITLWMLYYDRKRYAPRPQTNGSERTAEMAGA
jgi:hypothetical protein